MTHNDDPISIIEDLDPEPPGRSVFRVPHSAFGQWWEVALGLALLVGVLAFAGWQTLQQNAQQDNYAAGVRALSRQNWEEAQARFAAASGYRDADRQARAAAAKVDERNRQYEAAISFMKEGEWLACLDAIQRVTDIQPGYETSVEVEKQALLQTRTDAMSGTIALRPNATPSGLYVYSQTGWRMIPNSDKYSEVQSAGANGWVIYDAPGPGWLPGPSPTPAPNVNYPSELKGRIYMSVQLSDLAGAQPLSLDPTRYRLFASGTNGFWATGWDYDNYSRKLPVRDGYSGVEGKQFLYQSYRSDQRNPSAPTTVITFPTAIDSAVMALDLNSDRYLLADWSNVQEGAVVTTDTMTNLYLVGASGNREQLYSLRGGSFISAQFSPNGRYVLLATYSPLSLTSNPFPHVEEQAIVLIDLERANLPRTLGETVAQIDGNFPFNATELSWLTSAFVERRPFAGKVLLAQYEGDHYHLRIFDTATKGDATVDVRVPSDSKINWSIRSGNYDQMLVVGEDNSTSFVRNQLNSVRFVVISADGSSRMSKTTVGQSTFIENAAIFSDRLIYSTLGYGDAPITHSVFSLPLEHFNIKGRRPESTFKQTLPTDALRSTTFGSYNFRPGLFAYIEGNNLHAQNYPGDIDIALDHGVTRLYNPTMLYTGQSRLR